VPHVLGTLRVHRIPPRVRDDREPPPSVGRDGVIYTGDLRILKIRIFFREGLDRVGGRGDLPARLQTIAIRRSGPGAFGAGALIGLRGRTQQSLVLGPDRGIAYAGGSGQAIEIDDLDVAAAVTNIVRPLQRMGDDRYAVAAGADHLGDQFLRQHKAIAAGQVPYSQQPTRQSALHGVRGVAAGRLLGLDKKRHAVAGEDGAQRRPLFGRGAQPIDLEHRRNPGHQHDRIGDRNGIDLCEVEDAVAPDHRDLDPIPLIKFDEKRNNAAMRQEDMRDRVSDLEQHARLGQRHRSKMRAERFKIIGAEGSQ